MADALLATADKSPTRHSRFGDGAALKLRAFLCHRLLTALQILATPTNPLRHFP